MKKKLVITIVLIALLTAWVGVAYADYSAVAISFDKPRFCVCPLSADDGGSGKYYGLGYSFSINGYLDADSNYQVDEYTYKIFGISIKQGEANPNKG